MKSGRKEVSSKRSSREESKKATSQSGHVNNIKKISCSIPLNIPTSIATKSLMLNSHRVGKTSTIYTKNSQAQPVTAQHSRYKTSHLENFPSSKILVKKALLLFLPRTNPKNKTTSEATQQSAKNN